MTLRSLISKFIIIGAIVSFIGVPVYAHELEKGAEIGAVLHINPNDDPRINEEAVFFFEFKSSGKERFEPKDCACQFSLKRDGKAFYDKPLFERSHNATFENALIFYTFKEQGDYTANIVGTPKDGATFEAFDLDFPVEVGPARQGESKEVNRSSVDVSKPESEQSQPNYFIYAIGGIGLVMLASGAVVIYKKSKLN